MKILWVLGGATVGGLIVALSCFSTVPNAWTNGLVCSVGGAPQGVPISPVGVIAGGILGYMLGGR